MDFQSKRLTNGLRLLLVPRPEALSATVLIMVAAGSDYEKSRWNGLSHFLEHMTFKGTTKRPRSFDISAAIEALGASHNAFTGHEYTGYYVRVAARHLLKSLDIVSDLYLEPLFPAAEMEKEKGVIIQEINMYHDDPKHHIYNVLRALFFGEQAAGRAISGTKETVSQFTRADLMAYHQAHYVPASTVCVVAGSFVEPEVADYLTKRFGAIASRVRREKPAVRHVQTAPRLSVLRRDSDQSHLLFGFSAPDLFDADHYATEVLAQLLGGGMSSRLFQRIREVMGAAYYVYAADQAATNYGMFTIGVGTGHDGAPAVIRAVLEECRRLIDERVTEEELRRVKDALVGQMYLGLETTSALARAYGIQAVLQSQRQLIQTPLAIQKKVEAVTTTQIGRLARSIFNRRNINLALIGPFASRQSFVKLLEI